MTQSDLALKTQVSYQQIHKYEQAPTVFLRAGWG